MSHLLIVSQEDELRCRETLNPEDDWIRHVNVIFRNVVDMMTLIEILKAHYCHDVLSRVLDVFLLGYVWYSSQHAQKTCESHAGYP